jgi:hypothetical protein
MKKLLLSGIAAAAILSAPAPTLASDHERVGQLGGGIDIGPLGQCFDPWACGRGYYRGYYGYAFFPPYRYYRHHRYYRY